MGTDIHSYAEYRNNAGQWEEIPDYEPFGGRSSNIFSFLAGVRFNNTCYYSDFRTITPYPIIDEVRGLPKDVSHSVKAKSDEEGDAVFGRSWLSIDELASYNYDKPLRDRNIECVPVPEGLVSRTVRDALGDYYFNELAKLKKSKAERIVFWFDN